MGAGPSQGFVEPIMDNSEQLMQGNSVQFYAKDGEQPKKNTAPSIHNVVVTSAPVGLRSDTTFDQMVQNKDHDKPKMVLHKWVFGYNYQDGD